VAWQINGAATNLFRAERRAFSATFVRALGVLATGLRFCPGSRQSPLAPEPAADR